MSAGVLEFTLGLAAGGFNRAIDGAGSKLSGFVGGIAKFTGIGAALAAGEQALRGMGNVVEGVMGAIERGAALEHLSRTSGESVRNLFLLQQGLKAVGLQSDSAGNMVFMLQRALGGVSEEGVPTGVVFSQLGLSIEQLKAMDAPTALQAIAASLGRLDNASASSAAAKIFGRGSSREFLQMARSSEEFTAALKGNAAAAAIMERNAAAFAKVEIGLTRLKGKAAGLFAGIAEGVAPALQNVINMLDSIDLTGVGQQIGKLLLAVTQAFREGKLAELIGESFKLGFESVLILAPAMFEKLGYMLVKMFETPLMYFQAGMQYAIEQAMEGLGRIPFVGEKMGLDDFKGSSFGDIMKAERETGPRFNLGSGEFGTEDINKDANDRLAEARKRIGEISAPLLAMIDGLAARAPKGPATPAPAKGTDQLVAPYHVERTALEKMGFVMQGHAASDPSATTAKNTTKLVALTEKLVNRMSASPGTTGPALTNSHA